MKTKVVGLQPSGGVCSEASESYSGLVKNNHYWVGNNSLIHISNANIRDSGFSPRKEKEEKKSLSLL